MSYQRSYQADNMTSNDAMGYLEHHGVLGMKWGVRNADTLRKYAGPKEKRTRTTTDKVKTGVGLGLAAASTIGMYSSLPLLLTGNPAGPPLYALSQAAAIPAVGLTTSGNPNLSKRTKGLFTGSMASTAIGATAGVGAAITGSFASLPLAAISSVGLLGGELGVLGSVGSAIADKVTSPRKAFRDAKDVYNTDAEVTNKLAAKKTSLKEAVSEGKTNKAESIRRDIDKLEAKKKSNDRVKGDYYKVAAEVYIKEHPDTKYSKAELMSKFKNGWNQ